MITCLLVLGPAGVLLIWLAVGGNDIRDFDRSQFDRDVAALAARLPAGSFIADAEQHALPPRCLALPWASGRRSAVIRISPGRIEGRRLSS